MLHTFDVETGQPSSVLQGHTDQICNISMAGDLLTSASMDGTVKLWDVRQGADLPLCSAAPLDFRSFFQARVCKTCRARASP